MFYCVRQLVKLLCFAFTCIQQPSMSFTSIHCLRFNYCTGRIWACVCIVYFTNFGQCERWAREICIHLHQIIPNTFLCYHFYLRSKTKVFRTFVFVCLKSKEKLHKLFYKCHMILFLSTATESESTTIRACVHWRNVTP